MTAGTNIGDKAPVFSLKDQTGKAVNLADYFGKKNVVLYFYPKDDTPGCTKEACAFRDEMPNYDNLDAQILGVSVDATDSHEKFAAKYNLNFPILSDANKTVAEAYGVLNEKGFSSRATFVIDKQGAIRYVFPAVKVDGHSQAVKEALQTLAAKG